MNFCWQNFEFNFFEGCLLLFLLASWTNLNRWNFNASNLFSIIETGAIYMLNFWEISVIFLHIFDLSHYFCFTIGSIGLVNRKIFQLSIILLCWGRCKKHLLYRTTITNDFGSIENFVRLSIGNLRGVLTRKNGENCIVVTFLFRWIGIFFTVNSSEHVVFNAYQISLSILAWDTE